MSTPTTSSSTRSAALIAAQKRYQAKASVKALHASKLKEKYNTDPEYRLKKLASMKAYRVQKNLLAVEVQ